MKWDAWYNVMGMEEEEACHLFVEAAISILEQAGMSTEDPEQATVEAEFERCMQ